ncbi:MAG: non-canonical purine NTP pyrophosphatase, partial [Candidatus Brocadiae bacterium]|nr:non-canonical purine NTP pyrophosphatase [Candidatus Brocadiia bacterium]
MEVLLGTRNAHKVAEIREILAGSGLRLVALPEDAPEIEETGETFEANAALKALAWARHFGRAVLADDSGLEVDALGGRPGVRSA